LDGDPDEEEEAFSISGLHHLLEELSQEPEEEEEEEEEEEFGTLEDQVVDP